MVIVTSAPYPLVSVGPGNVSQPAKNRLSPSSGKYSFTMATNFLVRPHSAAQHPPRRCRVSLNGAQDRETHPLPCRPERKADPMPDTGMCALAHACLYLHSDLRRRSSWLEATLLRTKCYSRA